MTYAILRLASEYALNLSSFGRKFIFVLGRVPSVLLSVILGPIGFFMTVCIPVYDNSYTTNLKMSTLLYGRSILKTLGVSGVIVDPFLFRICREFLDFNHPAVGFYISNPISHADLLFVQFQFA